MSVLIIVLGKEYQKKHSEIWNRNGSPQDLYQTPWAATVSLKLFYIHFHEPETLKS